MLYYMILKLVYFIYLIGLVYLILRALSYAVFSGDSFKSRMLFILKSIPVSFAWPLSALSKAGRKFIGEFIKLN